MEIIDFHTHIYPDTLAEYAIKKLINDAPELKNYSNGTVSELKSCMERNGIRQSVTLPIATKASQVDAINAAASANKDDAIVSFGTIFPSSLDFQRQVDILVQNKIKGVKLHPEYQDFYFDAIEFFPLYDMLQSAGIMVLIHAGKETGPFSGDHAKPGAIKKIINEFPQLRIIVAHLGGWKMWFEVEQVLAGENCYFDTAALFGHISIMQFMAIYNKHDKEAILFGSDSPWYDVRSCIQWIDRLPLGTSEKEGLFCNNAKQLLF